MDEAFALIELVRDADGRPVDARCLRANRAFERVGQCPREVLLDRPLSEVAPELHAWWVALHAGVVASGHGKQFVHSLQDVGQTWDVRLAPFGGDRVAVRLDDVTARLRAHRMPRRRRRGAAAAAAAAATSAAGG